MLYITYFQDYNHLGILDQYERYQSEVGDLSDEFVSAYELIIDSVSSYDSVKSGFDVALDSVETELTSASSTLKEFVTVLNGISDSNLKNTALNITLTINATYSTAYQALITTKDVCTLVDIMYVISRQCY